MRILALDTSSAACSAALSENGKILGETVMNSALTHSQTIMPAAESLLEREKLRPSDIDLVAVVAGPGSFTGVRIGVCAAKGLCQAINKPCVSVDALEAIAEGAAYEGLICPILDARREQVYTALFRRENGILSRVSEDAALPLSELLGSLPEGEKVYFTGDGLNTYEQAIAQRLGERALIAPMHVRVLRAASACFIAERSEPSDATLLTPIYLRASQAERERAERLTRARA